MIRFPERQRNRAWARLLLRLVLLAVVSGVAAVGIAEVSKEFQLKAVFLWRLAQFTEWPADAFESAANPIVICVLGEDPFGDALDSAVENETAHGRRLIVQRHRSIDQMRNCHILYLSAAFARRPRDIVSALAGKSVLTVSDGLPSANTYDSIVRFITEQNKIRLRIDVKAAAAAGLVLDPRLLRAAEIAG